MLDELIRYKKENGLSATLDVLEEFKIKMIAEERNKLVNKPCKFCKEKHPMPQNVITFICAACDERMFGKR
jgi:hypothetical protein